MLLTHQVSVAGYRATPLDPCSRLVGGSAVAHGWGNGRVAMSFDTRR